MHAMLDLLVRNELFILDSAQDSLQGILFYSFTLSWAHVNSYYSSYWCIWSIQTDLLSYASLA